MLRLTAIPEAERGLRIRMEGDLTARSAHQLDGLAEVFPRPPRRVCLDLERVRFVDAAGAARLRELAGKGAELHGASAYVRELLDGELAASVSRGTPDTTPGAASGEAALLARLRAGDEAAYDELVRTLGGRLLATARRLLRCEEEARDVVQEAFLSAFRGMESFSGGSKLSTWLHSITVNAALMRLRSRRRRPDTSIEDLLPRFDESGDWLEDPAGSNPPCDAVESEQIRTVVRRCIDELPETHRTVLLLRDIQDLSTAETAEVLGITPTAVKLRLHRARQALRTLLDREMR